jgi:hypothetical protein
MQPVHNNYGRLLSVTAISVQCASSNHALRLNYNCVPFGRYMSLENAVISDRGRFKFKHMRASLQGSTEI